MMRSSSSRRVWAVLAALAVVMSACGTRVDHDRVVAAAGGGGAVAQPGQAAGATGVGDSTSGVAGSDPGAVATEAGAAAAGGDPAATGDPGAAAAGEGGGAGGGAATASADGGAASGGAAAATGSPIVIGSVGNYSGPGGATIAAGAEALKVWARWINDRGGLAGHPVEVIVVDDGQDPARHQAAVKDLVENRNVLAFVAQMAPYSIHGAVDYLQQKRVPVVGGDCAEYLWNENSMFFNQCADLQTTLYGIVNIVAKFGKSKKWGILYCAEAQACPDSKKELVDNGLAEEAGLEPLYAAQVSIAQPDFTAECLEARNRGVEVITPIMDTNSIERIASSCARQGYHPQFSMSGGSIDGRAAANPLLEGAVVSTNTFPHVDIDLPAVKEFIDAFAKYAPKTKLQAFHSLGWTSAKLFEKAASGLGPNPTREALLEALWSIKDETLGGIASPITFVRDQPTPKSHCHFYLAIRDGKQQAPEGATQFCRP